MDYIDSSDVSGDTPLARWTVEAAVNFKRTGALACDIMLSWLDEFAKDFPVGTPHRQAGPGTDGAEFKGWVAPEAPPSYQIAPLALALELPQRDNQCPVQELTPWWDQIALRPGGSGPARSLAGKRMQFLTLPRTGGWQPSVSPDGLNARLAVFDDGHLEAWATHKFDRKTIKETGLIGSLVPGYAEIKNFASSVSTRSEYVEVGCQIAFDTISAVTVDSFFSTVMPLFGPWKAIIKERGYGSCDVFAIGLELTDGWRPLRLALIVEFPKDDEVKAANDFLGQLISDIASRRADLPWVSANDADVLRAQAAQDIVFQRKATKDKLYMRLRHEFPGSRPISIQTSDSE